MEYFSTLTRWSCQKKFVMGKNILKYIECFISYNKYRSFKTFEIIDNHSFLESVTGQKPYISNSFGGYVGSSKYFVITHKITLRKVRLFNFLKYLYSVVIPSDFRLNGLLTKLILSENVYHRTFVNWSNFFGQTQDNLDSGIGVRVNFNGNTRYLKEILRLLCIV